MLNRRSTRFESRCGLAMLIIACSALFGCTPRCARGFTRMGDYCVPNVDADAATAGTGEAGQAGVESERRTGPTGNNGGTPATGSMQNGQQATGGSGTTGTAGVAASGVQSGPAANGSQGSQPSAGGAAPSMNPASGTAGNGSVMGSNDNSGPSSTAGQSANTGAAGSGATACVPSAEICDNLDNDCDGKIDEEVPPQKCGSDKGVCKPGTIQCRSGKWDDPDTQCQGAVGPSPTGEECDAARLDENCDGVANENCACTEGETMPCATGKYTCTMGKVSCVEGKFSSHCDGEVQGTAEVCDGMDNDCDNTPDNGGDALCTGGLHCAGTARCVECTTDDQCRSKTDACNVGYCDLTRHKCDVHKKDDHTACSSSSTAGICRSGSCYNGCIDATDCDASRKEQCQSGRCVVPIECGNGKTEAGEECDDGNRSNNDNCLNSCKNAKCGDGYVNQTVDARGQPAEGCDTKDDAFNCDSSTCQRIYVYTPCGTQGANSAECGGGYCNGGGATGVCLPPCVTPASPKTSDPYECSIPNGRVGHCYGGCAMRCDIGGSSCQRSTCKESGIAVDPNDPNSAKMKFCLP